MSHHMFVVMYKLLKKIVGTDNFSAQFSKIIPQHKKIGSNITILRQTACLVANSPQRCTSG